MRILWCFWLPSYYMFSWRLHSQSIASWPSGSAHVYWILDLEGEMHSRMQETQQQQSQHWISSSIPSRMQGQCFFWSRAGQATIFGWIEKILLFFPWGVALPLSTSLKTRRGTLNVLLSQLWHPILNQLNWCLNFLISGYSFGVGWLAFCLKTIK